MGVPGLAPYIWGKFPKQFIKSTNLREMTKITSRYGTRILGIDGNALIHPFAQKVFLYGKNAEDFARKRPKDLREGWERVYQLLYEEILRITRLTQPTEVFIAIDGVAPVAKQIQQRTRRFASANSRDEKQIFDGNCISPGTEFMHSLSQFMLQKIDVSFSDFGVNKVLFSSATEPGEGEHKIVDYFRTLSKNENKDDICGFFYGPDADLIMLSLACPLPHVYLIREEQFPRDINHVKFEIFDIENIRKDFPLIIEMPMRKSVDVIRDFILIGFFVGNDFLPRVAMFDTLKKGLDKMILDYSKLMNHTPFVPITNRKGIDLDGFYNFLSAIADDEPRFFLNQIGNDKLVRNETLESCLKDTIPASIDWEKFRKKYYLKAGIPVNDNEAKITQMCIDYLTTLQWIFEYYTTGLPSWSWFYPWHYPPLLRDLVVSLETLESIPRPPADQPLVPFQQLMLILPKKSWELIPIHLHPVLEKLSKTGAFPDTFEYDCEGKGLDFEGNIKYHECIALLPFPDQKLFKDQYLKCPKPKTRFHKNEFSNTRTFVKPEN